MTSSREPTDQRPDAAPPAGQAVAGPEALRRLADQLHSMITTTFDAWGASATTTETPREAPSFSRPTSVPPVRMEQMARTPEPTADLDDLVDLLVPRLVEQLVPALREALRDVDQPLGFDRRA